MILTKPQFIAIKAVAERKAKSGVIAYVMPTTQMTDLIHTVEHMWRDTLVAARVPVTEGGPMTPNTKLEPGMIVQLSPDVKNPMFATCMMVVTEPKAWGAQGYVQALGENRKPGGQAYYRASWEEMELVGQAEWIAK